MAPSSSLALLTMVLCFLMGLSFAGGEESTSVAKLKTSSIALDIIHNHWDTMLKSHVQNGKVDYGAWRKDSASLNTYLNALAAIPRSDLENATRNGKLAAYINAYNAFTVKLVVDHPKVKSIRDISNPWKRKMVKLAGSTMSLDHLEHEILRKRFSEPRIHFAIVCASLSCPDLPSQAFFSANADSLFPALTRKFLADTTKNEINGKTTKLSEIFDWFSQDFERHPGGMKAFLKEYAPSQYNPDNKITYKKYSWELNGSQ